MDHTTSREPKVDVLMRRGREAHPDLRVEEWAWARHLERAADGGTEGALDELRAEDLHLVLACLSGDPRAHARLDGRLRAVAPQALSGIQLGAVSLDDLLQELRAKLLVGSGDGDGKLATYSGRGPLDGWLRVTLARLAISRVRVSSPQAARRDETDALANVAASDDPQLAALQARCAPALERAIKEAVAALADEERALLRLYFVESMTIDDLAVIYRAHRATMARRIARVRNKVFEDARSQAMRALGLDEAEFASLVGLVLSKLDFTIRGALRGREHRDRGD